MKCVQLMKKIFIKWIINIVSLIMIVHIVAGIYINNWKTFALVAIALTLINTFLKPIIIIFTLPLNVLSLGLFTLIINGAIFYLVSIFVEGFIINNFWSAFWGAFVFSIISFLLNIFFKIQGNVKTHIYRTDNFTQNRYRDVIDVEPEKDKHDMR